MFFESLWNPTQEEEVPEYTVTVFVGSEAKTVTVKARNRAEARRVARSEIRFGALRRKS